MGLILAKNKMAAKVMLRQSGVLVPGNKKYPKIVKLLDEESSRGITNTSVVHNHKEELTQIKKLKKSYRGRYFSEEFIAGRELHVAVYTKNKQLRASPIWETTFGRKLGPHLITEKVKWNFSYRDKMGVKLGPVKDISPRMVRRIQQIALKSCKVLHVNGFARVDMRLGNKNKVYVLEVNPNPDIAKGDEFAECLLGAGIEYNELVSLYLLSARIILKK